ncbi:MAG: DivIVA domain-containing protein [Ilumatobacter sp.]|nr:MAG: DivIVA domain-containing protein [Ilumatobacter sp.]
MALSFSRPDPSSPASIADATFSTARRGFDQREVRDVLREVAAELERLIDRERFLQHELRTAQETTVDPADALDEETVSRVLGEETLRVLQTARESSAQIKSRAEESAARVIREASDEANRIRNEADADAARIRSDASADAEAELSLAKQQGREMVNEARAYRERVLSELGRRREAARQQIEQLVSGRDRLLQVFERARLVSVDVMSDLAPLDELDEYVNLSPTTDPVPIMVPARDASLHAGSEPEPEPEPEVEPEAVDEVDPESEVEPEPEAVDEPDPEAVDEAEPEAVDEVLESAEPEPEPEPEPEVVESEVVESEVVDSNVVALFGQRDADPAETDPAGGLFARLRAETAAGHAGVASGDETGDETGDEAGDETGVAGTESLTEPEVAADVAADVAAEPEETVFQRRDADLVPLILAAARKLKRVLADEQNEALDTLRGKAVVRELDDLVPIAEDHVERFAAAMTDELVAAARAGALLLDPDGPTEVDEVDETVLGPVRELIADGLVQPLRSRLERAVADGGGENDQVVKKVRAVYREWKTTHIDDQLDDVLRLAHGVGAAAALTPGTPMCWSVDPDGPACPDAEDNALAGAVAAGEPYPTGHRLAPAHPGCRCLIVPTGN